MTLSTTQSFRRSWSLFNEFTVNYKISRTDTQMPFSSQLITVFVAYLFNKGFQASSIRSHLSYSHRNQGLPFPVWQLPHQQTSERGSSSFARGRYASSYHHGYFKETIACHSCVKCGPLQGSFILRYVRHSIFAFLRCSEYCASPHCLLFHQLYMCPSGDYATIDFRSFKHSTAQKRVIIRLESKSDLSICPIYHLKHYLQLRGTRPGPLFCDINGAPISRNAFNSQLRTCLKVLNLDCQQYKAHSFRIGVATHAL